MKNSLSRSLFLVLSVYPAFALEQNVCCCTLLSSRLIVAMAFCTAPLNWWHLTGGTELWHTVYALHHSNVWTNLGKLKKRPQINQIYSEIQRNTLEYTENQIHIMVSYREPIGRDTQFPEFSNSLEIIFCGFIFLSLFKIQNCFFMNKKSHSNPLLAR